MIPVYYSVRSLWTRRLSTALTVLGMAMVVFVFTAVLMLGNGIEVALATGADPRNVIVLRDGSDSEIASGIEPEAVRVLASSTHVASTPDGDPFYAAERVVIVSLERPEGFSNITLRGVEPTSFALRKGMRIVSGRAPRPGTNEIVVGSSLAGRYPGATVGGEIRLASQPWPVVGTFVSDGSAHDSEIWADVDRVGASFDRPVYSSATFRMRDEAGAAAFVEDVKAQPGRYELEAQREDLYWNSQSLALATFIRVLGLFVTFVFSFGAVLGAMITMYAQVANRIRELATLRAIGFRRRSVLASVLAESAVLGGAGGALGAFGAFLMRWVDFHTLNFQTFSEVRFSFEPTPGILLGALAFGLVIGVLGGTLPAVRAARLPILVAARGG